MAWRARNEPGADATRRRALAGAAALAGMAFGAPALARQPVPDGGMLPQSPDAPIRLISNLFSRLAARVMINGRGPFVFVIDTGASRTCVTDVVVEAMGLPLAADMVVHGVTSADVTRSVVIDQLQLAGMTFEDIRAPILSYPQLGAHGLIGLDILAGFGLGFDVVGGTITLVPGGGQGLTANMQTVRTIQPNGVRSRRGAYGQLILTDTFVNDLRVAAFIDSGAQHSIGNRALLDLVATRRPEGLDALRQVPIFGVTGQSLSGEIGEVADVRLGRVKLGPTPLLFADLHCFRTMELADRPALLIGADLLTRFRRINIDFARNRVVFDGLRRSVDPGGLSDRITGAG